MGWKHKFASSIFTQGFVSDLKRQLRLVVCRILCFSPWNFWRLFCFSRRQEVKLNIGSGKQRNTGWISVDLVNAKSALRWDIRWGLPFKTGSVSKIHCEHFLEHLEYPGESVEFLKECRRVLKRGGQLRVIVPDAQKYMRAYLMLDQEFWQKMKDLGGANPPFKTEIEVINQAFRMGGEHRFAYDRRTLTRALNQAGFEAVLPRNYSPSEHLDQGDDWRLRESLYLLALNT